MTLKIQTRRTVVILMTILVVTAPIVSAATIIFQDTFEDETLDSGLPDGWKVINSGSGTFEVVDTTPYGDRAFNATASSSVKIAPDHIPYAEPRVDNVSVAAWVSGSDVAELAIGTGYGEDGTDAPVIDIERTAGSISVDQPGGSVTITNDPTTENYVEFGAFDIDPENDTFRVWWETESGSSGTSSTLSLNGPLEEGWTYAFLEVTDNNANEIRYDNFTIEEGGTDPEPDLSGTVVNQNGQPIRNATVQVIGVDYSAITAAADETKAEVANRELVETINKTPSLWEDQQAESFQLLEPGGHIQDVDTTYVAVHEREDWIRGASENSLRDPPDLDQPILTTGLEEGGTKTIALSCWDPEKEQGTLLENDVDQQLPGKPTSCNVKIETLISSDTAFETTTARVVFREGGALGNLPGFNLRGTPEEYQSAFLLVDVTPGYYRVYPEDNEASSYVIKIGDPIEYMATDFELPDGNQAEQAAATAEKIADGTFTNTTTTTDAQGEWSVSTGANVKTVAIQAYKAPEIKVNSTGLSTGEIIETYRDTGDIKSLGSVYFSVDPKLVEPPESNITIEMREEAFPPNGNFSKFADKLESDRLRQLVDSLADALGLTQQRLDDMSRDELEAYYADLVEKAQQNQEWLDQAEETLDENTGDDGDRINVDPDDATVDELKDRIEALNDALNQIEDSIESGTPTSTSTQDTVSVAFPFDAQLAPENVMVLAHWSNGTTTRLNASSEYVTIEDRLAQGDVVHIDDFPLGENETNAVDFEVIVSTPNGVGTASRSVVNPTFNNDVPDLQSISLTSLRPGSGEKVDLELHPDDESTFGSITSVTVTAPDGSTLSTDPISADGRSTGFTAKGAGVHHIQVTFNNSDGDEFTETIRIKSDEIDRTRAPSVQAKSGPTGVYALVGDGLDSGKVETNADGSQVSMNAQIGADQSVPGTIHFYAEGLDGAPRTDYTLRVVRGDSEQSINQQVGVVLHSPSITSETPVIYRQSDQPIPREGSNQRGEVTNRGNGTTLESFTESDGSVRFTIDNQPDLIDRGWYRARLFIDDPSSIGSTAVVPMAPAMPGQALAPTRGLVP